jgi:uncharacterized membrane protein YbjE (DUF340 family)
MPARIVSKFTVCIGCLVWFLLFLIGMEFGIAFRSLNALGYVLGLGAGMAVATTIFPVMLLMMFWRIPHRPADHSLGDQCARRPAAWLSLGAPLKECGVALALVCAGVLAQVGGSGLGLQPYLHWLPDSEWVLLALIAFVGIDLSAVKLEGSWLSWRLLSVPVLVVTGSWIGAGVIHATTGEDLRLLMALSSGFGWFTLSSALVASLSGELHGAVALIVDLGRELIAIVLLYLTGRRHPALGIAAGGAASMDSTLPIVRQTCPRDAVPVALVSGVSLTLLAPFLISAFLQG